MKKLTLAFMSVLFLFMAPAVPVSAQAEDLCKQQHYQNTEFCNLQSDDSNTNPVLRTINTVINLFALIGSVAAVIMTIIGGFKYVTSSGDPQATSSARNTIIYSLVGLIVIILARFIVLFVIDRIS